MIAFLGMSLGDPEMSESSKNECEVLQSSERRNAPSRRSPVDGPHLPKPNSVPTASHFSLIR